MNLAGVLARSGEGLKSGPIGFAVILVLCVACYFLFKSMSKHLRKVREEFPADPSASPAPPSQSAPSTPSIQSAPSTQSAPSSQDTSTSADGPAPSV